MSKDNEKGPSPTDRGNGSNPNVAFYLIVVIFAITGLSWWLVQSMRNELSYPDLVRLIKASARKELGGEPLPTSTGIVPVKERPTTEVKFRYSNLRDVRLGPRTVEGVLDSVQITPEPDSTKPRERRFRTYKADSEKDHEELKKLLTENHITWKNTAAPGFFKVYGPILIITLLLIAFLLFVMRRMGGAGSPMQFGRSRGKLYALEDLGVTFDHVAGIDEAVEEVREVVDFLRSPEKYQRLGGRIPKGVLLVGPPGTGKTLLAKAIAGEAGVPFFSISGSDFVEMFVGVGAARVRDMFHQAEAKAPCIIFIDELDALGKSRGGSAVGGHDEREQTLNALLVEMDGFDSNAGVIVMAATNRPETLDSALMRAGRFDRQVLVDRPDVRGREAILAVHVKQVKLGPNVDLSRVASITSGFVGADLANLVNEAALLAARREKSTVSMQEFNEGVERVTAGLEKKQRVMTDEEKNRVAYHESGHALVAYSLPNTDPVHKVSIIPRGLAALGYTLQRPERDRYLKTKSELESMIQVFLAGTIAEEIIYGDISTGAQNDLERATDMARAMVVEYGMSTLGRVNYCDKSRSSFLPGQGEDRQRWYSEATAREIDEQIRGIINEAIERVRHILDVRRAALESMTERLLEVESIDSEELKQIIEETSPGPLVVPGTADAVPSPSPKVDRGDNSSSEASG